jgi:HAD superfamily hydrolase (TIGR01509 family)
MTSKIKWLLVDIGDVLLLRNEHNTKSFAELLVDELGVDLELAQKINKIYYSTMEDQFISEDQFVADLKEKLNYDAPNDIFSYFERAYKIQRRPNTEFISFMDEVRSMGINTGILSNTIAIYSPYQESEGISRAGGFDPIIFSWKAKLTKPHKEIFYLATERLTAKPEEILFIDDKAGHLEGARLAGMQTLLFENTSDAISAIRSRLQAKNG